MIDFNKNVLLITGANGMLGRALMRKLEKYPANHIIGVDYPIDLRDEKRTENFFGFVKPDYVIHTAARVGGVKANSENLADFYTDNIKINTSVLECCHKFGAKKVISLLSTCVYPDEATYPLTEEQIHKGAPHKSNYAYAYAKRMLDIQSQAYRDQFGCNFITAVPNNLFGVYDNFHLNDSHVIPAMIRKIYEAKMNGTNVEFWGNGLQLREFTYVDDLADILLMLLNNYDERDPINIGNTEEYELFYVAGKIAEFLDFSGEVWWNPALISGQFRKPSSNNKFKALIIKQNLQFEYTKLEAGLKEVCDWFVKNYPDVRGVK